MISKLSHVCVYVLNQDDAFDFYVNKLGFKVETDAPMGNGFRWLTVSPPGQPDLVLSLMEIRGGMSMDDETAVTLRDLVSRGKLGIGVLITDDCRGAYEELKAKGVKFKKEPEEQFYGVETIMVDNSGNWYSLSQPKAH
jgi:catechol 2,3-dioxygenase-like lactoylglutathione lyase family enzyme